MKYFAYGSNMLTERLSAPTRCTSATPIGPAIVMGYKVVFTKKSTDGSGKATLINTCDESDIVYGVLFEINDSKEEIEKLDRAEGVSDGGYKIKDNFTVIVDGKPENNARTYIASEERCEEGLPVYDWYLALVVAGAQQHELDNAYISKMIEENVATKDSDITRKAKIEAFQILQETQRKNVLSTLKY